MTRDFIDGLIVCVVMALLISAIVYPPAAFIGSLVIILIIAFGGDA